MGLHGPWHHVRHQQQSLEYLRQGRPPLGPTLRWGWALLRPHRKPLLWGLVTVVAGVAAGLVPPLLLKVLVDDAIPHGRVGAIVLLALGMLLVPAAGGLVAMGQNYLNAVLTQGVVHDVRNRLYRHAAELGLEVFTATPAGEMHSRLINDAGALQTVLNQALLGLVANLLTVGLTLVTMVALDWRLALLAAGALPAFAVPVLYFGRRRYDAVQETQEALARMTAILEETLSLSGALVVKSFGMEQAEAERFARVNGALRAAQIRQALVGQWMTYAIQVLTALGPAVLYGYGGYLVVRHQVQLGTVVAFAAYLSRLYAPASGLAGANATVLGGLALLDRLRAFLETPVRVRWAEPGLAVRPAADMPALAFDHVWFAYREAEWVLSDVSFEARPGQLVALVGPSGAGKSTLLALAARFYDPDRGAVRVFGTDLTRVDRGAFRRAVAVVTQDLFLFHATLRANLTYGHPGVSPDALEAAIEAAQLRDVVARLPEGLETVVGERGWRLSGGEKQRVAIARAILHDPQILLLDEATSALDSHAERLIQAALARLFRGRTVLAIAHRLSTILAADLILVVDRGRIVDRGTHTELLARGGLYRRLYEEQFGRAARGPRVAREVASWTSPTAGR
ncbi:MAG: ABC transporter ATP-binding protein/permease [Actinomycetia bacterium]|nr:ABC transporter ATP-binding protein/permease [Actinomycetes bacterium]